MRRLTIKDLDNWYACVEGKNWFKKNFPKGIGPRNYKRFITELMLVDDSKRRWNAWLAIKLAPIVGDTVCYCRFCLRTYAADKKLQTLLLNYFNLE